MGDAGLFLMQQISSKPLRSRSQGPSILRTISPTEPMPQERAEGNLRIAAALAQSPCPVLLGRVASCRSSPGCLSSPTCLRERRPSWWRGRRTGQIGQRTKKDSSLLSQFAGQASRRQVNTPNRGNVRRCRHRPGPMSGSN